MLAKIVLVVVCMCAGAISAPDAGAMAAWKRNVDATLAFACHEPQRRAIKATQLLGDRIERWDAVIPHTAVLHRCESSTGCCNGANESCGPVKTEDVDVVFLVLSRSKGKRYEVHKAKNHTKCGCKRTRSVIK